MNTQQKIDELKAKLAELEQQYHKEQQAPKKWEPKGGDWAIPLFTYDVVYSPSDTHWRRNGLERDNQEQAEAARTKLRQYARLLAWIDEHGGAKEFVRGESNHCLYFSPMSGSWLAIPLTDSLYLGAVYMSRETAQLLADKLNSGEVVL